MSNSLLPHNATDQERAIEAEIHARLLIAVSFQDLWDQATCPDALLPWLASAFSVDDWDPNWSDDAKRNSIAASIDIHRRKGTIGAVKRALASAGYGDATVVERFGWEFHNGAHSYSGEINYSEPDHWAEYRVVLTRPITIEQAAQVRAILANAAPARSHLKALDFTEALNIHNARITYDGQFTHGVA